MVETWKFINFNYDGLNRFHICKALNVFWQSGNGYGRSVGQIIKVLQTCIPLNYFDILAFEDLTSDNHCNIDGEGKINSNVLSKP